MHEEPVTFKQPSSYYPNRCHHKKQVRCLHTHEAPHHFSEDFVHLAGLMLTVSSFLPFVFISTGTIHSELNSASYEISVQSALYRYDTAQGLASYKNASRLCFQLAWSG